MATDVIIKILDTNNNLDFEIPISSDHNSPLSITKALTDLTELTKKGGVQSKQLKIPISKEVARSYDFFNQAQHDNNKDVDSDKEAVIIIDGNEAERGKVRITDFENKEGFESLTLLFFGNNFVWTELGKNLTMADIDWAVNSYDYTPTRIGNGWNATVDFGNEHVFPLENRGGRKLLSMVHTEDFRPAFFVHSLLTRFYQNIGYTFESNFINTTDFKKLVLSFFGKRFRIKQDVIDANVVIVEKATDDSAPIIVNNSSGLNGGSNILYYDYPINAGLNQNITFSEVIDDSNNYDPNGGTSFINASGTINAGRFTAPFVGNYKVTLKEGLDLYAISPSGSHDRFHYITYLRKFDASGNLIGSTSGYSRTEVLSQAEYLGTSTAISGDGDIVIHLLQGESVEFWRLIHDYNVNDGTNSKFAFWHTWSYEFNIDITLEKTIPEFSTFNFQDVLDNEVKVLDIINDLGRMFNLVFDTDPVLRKVTIEPRNDFYNEISSATEVTDRIDTSKPIKTIFNSSFHKRDMIFSYAKDGSDNFVKERDKIMGSTMAEYSHNLPSKFREGTTTIKTSVIAASYFIRDIDSIAIIDESKAPYTTRYWDSFETETPLEMLEDHKPRILNYVHEEQLTDGVGSGLNEFRFYIESTNRTKIPALLSHNITNGSNTLIAAPFNLFWHKIGTVEGLFGNNWSKTITEIVNGVSTTVTMLFNQKQWNDFKFKDVVYVDEPIEIKGYWLVEKIENFQPENSNLVKVKLLQRIEYDVQVEAETIVEQLGLEGRFAPQPISNQFNMTMTVQDGNGNEMNVLMETGTTDGTKTTMIT